MHTEEIMLYNTIPTVFSIAAIAMMLRNQSASESYHVNFSNTTYPKYTVPGFVSVML